MYLRIAITFPISNINPHDTKSIKKMTNSRLYKSFLVNLLFAFIFTLVYVKKVSRLTIEIIAECLHNVGWVIFQFIVCNSSKSISTDQRIFVDIMQSYTFSIPKRFLFH